MLSRINQFFKNITQPASNESQDIIGIEMATTVLLCEVMKADGHLDINERNTIEHLIAEHFQLMTEEIHQLIVEAIELSEHATDFHQFTTQLNQHFSIEQKVKIVSSLWQLAMADGKVTAIEEHTIRKIADLLHLRRHEYARAKEVMLN